MRAFIKKQLIDLLDSMEELQRVFPAMTDKQQITHLLADCQEAAIAVGNILENDSSDHKNIVSKLEEYCEEAFVSDE